MRIALQKKPGHPSISIIVVVCILAKLKQIRQQKKTLRNFSQHTADLWSFLSLNTFFEEI